MCRLRKETCVDVFLSHLVADIEEILVYFLFGISLVPIHLLWSQFFWILWLRMTTSIPPLPNHSLRELCGVTQTSSSLSKNSRRGSSDVKSSHK